MADDLTQFVQSVSSEQYVLETSVRRFKPWHKPRKQLVRRLHINGALGPLLEEGDGPIRYLGLPGPDLLDLHWMQRGVCQQYGRGLLFVGFDIDHQHDDDLQEAEDSDRFTIEADKLAISGIDDRSLIVKTAFQSLTDLNSIGFVRAQELAAFDLVNIDLCGGLAQEEPSVTGLTVYNALANLLGLQVTRHLPWILMVTTRVDHGYVGRKVKGRFARVIEHNLTECEGFSKEFESHFGFPNVSRRSRQAMSPGVLAQVWTLAISKWIIVLAADKNMPASLVNAISYTVHRNNGHPDLLSLAFRIEPAHHAPAFDPFEIARFDSHQDLSDECVKALDAMKIVHTATDADELLESSPELLTQATNETAELLAAAGYSEDAYRSWLGKS